MNNKIKGEIHYVLLDSEYNIRWKSKYPEKTEEELSAMIREDYLKSMGHNPSMSESEMRDTKVYDSAFFSIDGDTEKTLWSSWEHYLKLVHEKNTPRNYQKTVEFDSEKEKDEYVKNYHKMMIDENWPLVDFMGFVSTAPIPEIVDPAKYSLDTNEVKKSLMNRYSNSLERLKEDTIELFITAFDADTHKEIKSLKGRLIFDSNQAPDFLKRLVSYNEHIHIILSNKNDGGELKTFSITTWEVVVQNFIRTSTGNTGQIYKALGFESYDSYGEQNKTYVSIPEQDEDEKVIDVEDSSDKDENNEVKNDYGDPVDFSKVKKFVKFHEVDEDDVNSRLQDIFEEDD